MSATRMADPIDQLDSGDPAEFRRRQVVVIGTMYAGYAASMVLRMIPTVAGNAIRHDPELGIDLEAWGRVLAAGTCGAMAGKFLCGWAADRFGGKKTFSVALCVASVFVALFALSSSLRTLQATFFVVLMAQAAGWPSRSSARCRAAAASARAASSVPRSSRPSTASRAGHPIRRGSPAARRCSSR